MVKDAGAFEQLCEAERWEALRRMTVEESIAIGEALLTSDVMRLASFDVRSQPMSLAVALGVRPSAG